MATETRRPAARFKQLVFILLALHPLRYAEAALELSNSRVHEFSNGLIVILLEDRNFPVISVQMMYKVGARNELTGKTGLAHFVEHMAFRETENFPDTDVVSRIYARGGEWHGYTWIDQTSYYATAPKENLDLLLRIEADRMARLRISADDIEAERGAVLAEMHMYENSPTSVLMDALMFTSFLAHPYRNNTIGFEDDIDSVTHADVLQFYKQHYHPANAVLAVVGDFDGDAALRRIDELFGEFARRPATPPPHTREPPQQGMRRVDVRGATTDRRFMIAYRAPAFADADFPVFLVLQELLGGGSGVNFLQNDWGTPLESSGLLYGISDELTTWLPPSAQDYVFVIGGRVADDTPQPAMEQAIEDRLQMLRDTTLSEERVSAAVSAALDQLVFDVQSTEDAAHQLAFYAGLDALHSFLGLPTKLQSVTAADVRRVARRFLNPEQRTIASYRQGAQPLIVDSSAHAAQPGETRPRPEPAARDDLPVTPPVTQRLGGGIPLLIKTSDLSSSVYLKVVIQGHSVAPSEFVAADPVVGYSGWHKLSRPSGFADAVALALAHLRSYPADRDAATVLSRDPETRMQQEFAVAASLAIPNTGADPVPSLIVVAGDIQPQSVQALLASSFGRLESPQPLTLARGTIPSGERTIRLGIPVAQARLGYIVAAPAPTDPDFDAYRLLQYIVSHDYEGRLGKEAISRRGLAYYIDARYHSAGGPGWMTLDVGVDPDKVDRLKQVLFGELRRLETQPPTPAEVEEAKNHLLGRAVSAAQSNEELAVALARDWLWYGEPSSVESLRERLGKTDADDVRRAVAAFTAGLTITVIP